MCWSCIFGKGSAIMRGGQKKSLSPSCPLPPLPPLSPFSERRALRAAWAQLFPFFPPYIFSQFFFPLLHPAPLLPPPFPSSPLPLTLSAPQLSDTSVLQEVKCDIIKTRLPLF